MPMKTTFDSRRGRAAAHGDRDLLDDLARREVALEPGLPGGAELARHGATGLGGDADRHPVGVAHQDGLDPGVVAERPQPLCRLAVIGAALGHLA